jgi:CRP-like cAMP-binding protein
MGFGSAMKPCPYMREHSQHIRFLSKHSGETIEEDPVISGLSTSSRIILVISCRNRQRLLSHAWQLWVNNTAIFHNYKQDVITILSRIIPEDELRTEFEIEVIFKWVLQNHHIDPTGIAYTLYMCNSKVAIVKAIQHFRLERYSSHCPIMLQNDYPRPEEGHYTILQGLVDIVIFPPDSPELLRLHTAKKNKHEAEIIQILNTGTTIDTMPEGAGFGELSTITGMKRSASVRAHESHQVDLLVLPQIALMTLLQHRRVIQLKGNGVGNGGNSADQNDSNIHPNYPSAEVMDYLRQSGLIYKAAMIDVMEAARCMIKTQYLRGSILYQKGDIVQKIYIILYGEILLDTRSYQEGFSRDFEPFQHLDLDKCYLLRSGSILGDEGMGGKNQCFESSAIVLSETAVFFEVTGYGITFLLNRLGIEKYSALVYKDIPVEIEKLESLNDDLILHSTFMSLRKAMAMQNPFRGQVVEVKQSYQLKDIEILEQEQEQVMCKIIPSATAAAATTTTTTALIPSLQGNQPRQKQTQSSTISSPQKSLLLKTNNFHPSGLVTTTIAPRSTSSRHHPNRLNRLPMSPMSRLSSPGSRGSTPILPSDATPLGLMLSSNRRLSQAITRKANSPHSPSRPSSQTNILRLDTSNDQHEFTIFETKNYSRLGSPKPTRSTSPHHPSSSHGQTRGRSRGGLSEPTSPNHRPYSRQSDKEAFFKTLEGAQYKKVKILKQAALHHVQSIYKLIKKREMRSMRYQAAVSAMQCGVVCGRTR